MVCPPAYLSMTSSPPTSSLSTPLRPSCLHAAPRMCHTHLHPRASISTASSSWSRLASESSRASFFTSMLQYHPSQEEALIILSNTSPPHHCLSPMILYFMSVSRPDRCRQSHSVSLHWDIRSRRAGTQFVLFSALSPEPRRVPGTQ